MQNTASNTSRHGPPVDDGVSAFAGWVSRKILEQRVAATRRLTQDEIGKLPENLQRDISSNHQDI